MPNRLARETSPYLLQHADNPVDWYPWGEEALSRARAEDRPILLSIGYSACHWCHVMAHESFEDPGVAAIMNRHFVNVKVDREERPDLDHIYQTAHQMLTQRAGGWPLTVFLAPDGMPFFAGTYFPKTARWGMPGFAELLERIAAIWRERRAEIEAQGRELRRAFAASVPAPAAEMPLSRAPIDALLATLRDQFDPRSGGFGPAPKFPHPTDLELCLREHALRGDGAALEMAETTLRRMCEGGIFDQLGGGFARYSVDATWTIPHFEKMLYDNGQLLAVLADAWCATKDPLFARCAAETAAWIMREMQLPEGGYCASLDADSEGEEGRYYVWSRDEVRGLLAPEEWRVAAAHWGLDLGANFEGRHWHLYVARPLETAARLAGVSAEQAARALASARAKLLAARARRAPPGRDEKVLTAWNALAIRGMARAGRVFGRADWIHSARRAYLFLRTRLWRDGRLYATYKDGRARFPAYLDDYAFLAAAVLELLQDEFHAEDLAFVRTLADELLARFADSDGGFCFTANDHEALLHRPRPVHDSALPSGSGVAAHALGRLHALTGEARYARAAERTLQRYTPLIERYASATATLCMALDEQLSPPATLVLTGEGAAVRAWAAQLSRRPLPDTALVVAAEGVELPAPLAKPPSGAAVTAWLCRGATCLPPVTDLEALEALLAPSAA